MRALFVLTLLLLPSTASAQLATWTVQDDIVDPFIGLPHAEASVDWIVESELVDPWDPRFAYLRTLRAPRRESAIALTAPDRTERALPSVSLASVPPRTVPLPPPPPQRPFEATVLGGLDVVGDSPRGWFALALALRRNDFRIALQYDVGSGMTQGARSAGAIERTAHARHALAIGFQHRARAGLVSVDLGAAFGLLVYTLGGNSPVTGALPLLRLHTTAGLRVTEWLDLVGRLEAGTTFVAPGDFTAGGPSGFDVAVAVGARLAL